MVTMSRFHSDQRTLEWGSRPSRSTRSELNRENQQQMITMTSELSGRAIGDVIKDVKTVLAANPAPSGVRVELAGQYASQQDAFRQMLLVLALAATSVVGVMVIQWRDGDAAAHRHGAQCVLVHGLILLVGLIVKNGIILLDFTHWRMAHEGMELGPAIRDAVRVRLRPILMTTLCTLFGLLPLALGIGAGSELQKPLALATSTACS